MTRKFSSISVQSALATGVSNSALVISVAAGTGSTLLGGVSLAGGNTDQYSIILDPDTVNAEIMWVTGVSGDNLTVLRGKDGTSAISHTAGAIIKHVITAGDLTYFTVSAAPTGDLANTGLLFPGSTSGTVAVKTIPIAGTNTMTIPAATDTFVGKATTDTLTNKTLTAPVIATIVNTGTLTLPVSTDTLVGQATTDNLTNKTLVDPKIVRGVNNQIGTTYTIVLTDSSKELTTTNASPIALTVPTNASVAFPIGILMKITNKGAGLLTISAVTPGTTTIVSQGAVIASPTIATGGQINLTKTGTEEWYVTGDIVKSSTNTAGNGIVVAGAAISIDTTITVDKTTTQVLTNKDLTSATNTLPTSVTTLTGTQTLANKTLTAPTIATITNAGTITIPSGTDTLTGRATTDTLTNKTVQAPLEVGQFLGAFGGAMNIDVTAGATQWFTGGGSSNPTFNFRGNSGATLNSLVSTGSMISVVIILAQGVTAYYPTAFTVDGVATAGVRWAGGIAPTAGNASANDVYTFTLWKTAATPTWWVFAGVTKFA